MFRGSTKLLKMTKSDVFIPKPAKSDVFMQKHAETCKKRQKVTFHPKIGTICTLLDSE